MPNMKMETGTGKGNCDGQLLRCLVVQLITNGQSWRSDPVVTYRATEDELMLVCWRRRGSDSVTYWLDIRLDRNDIETFLRGADEAGLRRIDESDQGSIEELIARYAVPANPSK